MRSIIIQSSLLKTLIAIKRIVFCKVFSFYSAFLIPNTSLQIKSVQLIYIYPVKSENTKFLNNLSTQVYIFTAFVIFLQGVAMILQECHLLIRKWKTCIWNHNLMVFFQRDRGRGVNSIIMPITSIKHTFNCGISGVLSKDSG